MGHFVMAQCCHLGIGIAVAADRTSMGSVTGRSTSGGGHNGFVCVTQSSLFHIGGVVAAGAGHISIPANFIASRSLCFMGYFIVTQSINGSIGVAVATAVLTSMGGKSCRSTSGSSHDCFILMLQLRNFYCRNMAAVASDGLNTSCQTCCSSGDLLSISTFCASMFTSPNAIHILINNLACDTRSFDNSTVSIGQLSRSDGNLEICLQFIGHSTQYVFRK